MSRLIPEAGTLLRYDYLWHRDYVAGAIEGTKLRPCVVVVAADKGKLVVAPITHSQPTAGTVGREVPPGASSTMGLDTERSWVIVDEVNVIEAADPGLVPMRPDHPNVTRCPPGLLKTIRASIEAERRAGRIRYVIRRPAC